MFFSFSLFFFSFSLFPAFPSLFLPFFSLTLPLQYPSSSSLTPSPSSLSGRHFSPRIIPPLRPLGTIFFHHRHWGCGEVCVECFVLEAVARLTLGTVSVSSAAVVRFKLGNIFWSSAVMVRLALGTVFWLLVVVARLNAGVSLLSLMIVRLALVTASLNFPVTTHGRFYSAYQQTFDRPT